MNCPKCGLSVEPGSSFCNHCGAPLNQQGLTLGGNAPAGSGLPVVGASAVESVAGAAYTAESLAAASVATGSEKTIWQEYPSLRTIFPHLVPVALLFLIAYLLVRWPNVLPVDRHPQWQGHDILEWGIPPLGVLILLIMLLRALARLRSVRYRLTTQRIFIEYGIISKRTDEIELEKYKDVFVNQDFWDKLVGCGDIQVITGDVTNPTVNIIDVIDPIGKKEAIRKAARERQAMLGLRVREQM